MNFGFTLALVVGIVVYLLGTIVLTGVRRSPAIAAEPLPQKVAANQL